MWLCFQVRGESLWRTQPTRARRLCTPTCTSLMVRGWPWPSFAPASSARADLDPVFAGTASTWRPAATKAINLCLVVGASVAQWCWQGDWRLQTQQRSRAWHYWILVNAQAEFFFSPQTPVEYLSLTPVEYFSLAPDNDNDWLFCQYVYKMHVGACLGVNAKRRYRYTGKNA